MHRSPPPPESAGSEVPPGQRGVPESRRSPVSRKVGDEEFRPPCVTVGSVPRAIECESDHWPGTAVLSRNRRDVCMVMLYANDRHVSGDLA